MPMETAGGIGGNGAETSFVEENTFYKKRENRAWGGKRRIRGPRVKRSEETPDVQSMGR